MTVPTQAAARDEARDPGRRQRRRSIVWLGCALMVVGLVIVGYLAWQLIGTNIISERRQSHLVEQFQRQWDPPPGREASADPSDVGQAGQAAALIRIPRFGEDYVIPVLEGVGAAQLSSGFGHLANSALPGQVGNYVIAAHRITHGEPLRGMPSLRPGDTVAVETPDTIYTYRLDTNPNDLVVDLHAEWVLQARPVNPDPDGVQPGDGPQLITLITCAELFHTNDRMVAFGHLIAAHRK